MKTLFLNIRCFLGIHHWADSGWLRFMRNTGILECDWCGKTMKALNKEEL